MASDTPQRLGDYEILRVLGAGGMGRVYQVRNVITDRIEAMKVLLPEISGQEEVAARFLREIKVLAALNHPHIARLHTALTIDNQLVMIMEYVLGQPISALLANGPIPVPEALTYIDQVLDALSYAHQQHVIHRDIKPANMMVTLDGMVKLMDFGIARSENEPTLLTAPGSTLGSMNYMSPEQVKGERTDERSDLYSLGISLYEMVTGERPFHGDSSFSLMAAHINQTPTPPVELRPDLPEGLNSIILTSIAKVPEQRFQSADAFRNAVRIVLRDVQESKTVMQGSQDATSVSSRTPLPAIRTAPITRPRTAPSTPVPAAATSAAAPTAPTTKVTPAPLPATPAAAAPAGYAPAPSSSNRGLFISLGAVVVLVALVLAGLYIPKTRKASAAPETPVAIKQPAAPPAQPASPPPPEAAQPETKAAEAPPPEPAKPVASTRKAMGKTGAQLSAADTQAAAAAEAAAKARAAELDAVEHEIDQLTGRAASANSSIENLQRQQASMGLGLRGDIASKAASMKLNLAKAQDAIGHSDLERAKRYSSMAASDLEALEKFLGR
ncbi:MAG TPA: serine/threonine-protein kinase [Terriglobales bacterium]|jgi:serine/threonine-protein kinase|nr:serine/threonine-protein kinase [Terriglobales bacterium]